MQGFGRAQGGLCEGIGGRTNMIECIQIQLLQQRGLTALALARVELPAQRAGKDFPLLGERKSPSAAELRGGKFHWCRLLKDRTFQGVGTRMARRLFYFSGHALVS